VPRTDSVNLIRTGVTVKPKRPGRPGVISVGADDSSGPAKSTGIVPGGGTGTDGIFEIREALWAALDEMDQTLRAALGRCATTRKPRQ
jgi:hypothetical protein